MCGCTSLLAVVALSFELGASTRASSQPEVPLVRFEPVEVGGLVGPVTAPRVRISILRTGARTSSEHF